MGGVPRGEKRVPIVGEYQGRPEGPLKYVPSLGMEVGTFVDPRIDLLHPKHRKGAIAQSMGSQTLMYHVPLEFRGPYKETPNGEPLGDKGWAMCLGIKKNGEACAARAMHRSGHCAMHGGALHPLDRKLIDWTAQPRWARFKYGKLPVEELDDEEISRGQIRNEDGSWTNNSMISKDVHDRMVRELFKRSDELLKRNLLDAVGAMTSIAKGTAYEPADRIKAAAWIWEKLRGKTPDIVIHQQEKPYEVIMTHITGGTRAESRAARGVATDEELAELNNFIDAEIEEETAPEPEPEEIYDEDIPDLFARVPEDPRPAFHGPLGKEVKDPPTDPVARDVWEKKKAENEDRIRKETEAARAALAENIKKARSRRYAAQAKGFDTVEDRSYDVYRRKVKGGVAIQFVLDEVKVPQSVLNKEKKRRRRDRDE